MHNMKHKSNKMHVESITIPFEFNKILKVFTFKYIQLITVDAKLKKVYFFISNFFGHDPCIWIFSFLHVCANPW